MATIGEKQNILNLMAKTFERRRNKLTQKEVSASALLDEFPHFVSYHGEVVSVYRQMDALFLLIIKGDMRTNICFFLIQMQQEFTLMHSGKQSFFLRSFTCDFMPRLLKIAANESEKYAKCLKFSNGKCLIFSFIYKVTI